MGWEPDSADLSLEKAEINSHLPFLGSQLFSLPIANDSPTLTIV
jgi:hypothetical protein